LSEQERICVLFYEFLLSDFLLLDVFYLH